MALRLLGYRVLLLLSCAATVRGQPGKCDQIPPQTTSPDPSENPLQTPLYVLEVAGNYEKYLPSQTYVLTLRATNNTRPFKQFMITAEDPAVDDDVAYFNHNGVDVGKLKTLEEDQKSKYSERCYSSVENNDNSDKIKIEMHWISPKSSQPGQRIRFRATVAENNEAWYNGEALTKTLTLNSAVPIDRPPLVMLKECKLMSEARYEVIFTGKWSRGSHSLHFPTRPDTIMFSHMVGASHSVHYTLWAISMDASEALQELAINGNISLMERDIIKNMQIDNGTRTLIRGKKHRHPHLHEPSHALFRVDRYHHLFSIAVAMKPSPDWFLGTSKFELCGEDGWLDYHELKMYPYDAGVVDGISYESKTSMTQPQDKVDRVAVGSFDKSSPFYQMNLNDLNPFAILEVRLLDVYPMEEGGDDENGSEAEGDENGDIETEEGEEPSILESRPKCASEWTQWGPCVPHDGQCGLGAQTRTSYQQNRNYYNTYDPDELQVRPLEHCQLEYETQPCFINCFD